MIFVLNQVLIGEGEQVIGLSEADDGPICFGIILFLLHCLSNMAFTFN
jgi:hypothetical protein